MEVIGLWSWQTYHTARFSPFPQIPSYLPLVWRFLFYIITDNALTHTHKHTQRQTQTLSQPQLLWLLCVGFVFLAQKKKICVIIIKVAGLSYVWLGADCSLLRPPPSSLLPPWGLSEAELGNLSFVNLHLSLLLLPEIRSREIMRFPCGLQCAPREKERVRYYLCLLCSV